MPKEIQLTKGQVAVVDDEDYDYLMQWKWSYLSSGYACRGGHRDGKSYMSLMHREIMGNPDGTFVDHIDGNKLNNCRSNLRIVTKQQSSFNVGKRRGCKSKHKGVYYFVDKHYKRQKCWVAKIKLDGKAISLGYFQTEREAGEAYNVAAIQYHGEHARLNQFTEEG